MSVCQALTDVEDTAISLQAMTTESTNSAQASKRCSSRGRIAGGTSSLGIGLGEWSLPTGCSLCWLLWCQGQLSYTPGL